jgi:hypothetical protein
MRQFGLRGECGGGETDLDECKPRKGHAASHTHAWLQRPRNGVTVQECWSVPTVFVGGRWMAWRSDGCSEADDGHNMACTGMAPRLQCSTTPRPWTGLLHITLRSCTYNIFLLIPYSHLPLFSALYLSLAKDILGTQTRRSDPPAISSTES